MALDTRNRRASAINVGSPWRGLLPEPDGEVEIGDRAQLAFFFVGKEEPVVTASADITEAADTVASTATVEVEASGSATEASDTLAAEADAEVQAEASVTEAADTAQATAKAEVNAGASIVEAADSLDADAKISVSLAADITEAADTTSTLVQVKVTASASFTEARDTAKARGVTFIMAVGQQDEEKKKKRRKRQRNTIEKLLDHAIESSFEHFEARDEIKREIDAPGRKPLPIFEQQLLPDPRDLAALAGMQAELDRLQSNLPAVARAVRQQREEEDIELLLMSMK